MTSRIASETPSKEMLKVFVVTDKCSQVKLHIFIIFIYAVIVLILKTCPKKFSIELKQKAAFQDSPQGVLNHFVDEISGSGRILEF